MKQDMSTSALDVITLLRVSPLLVVDGPVEA